MKSNTVMKLTKDTPLNEVPEDVSVWEFNQHRKYLNHIGSKIPNDFLIEISDGALWAVNQWLNDNNAPEGIISLLNNGHTLKNEIIGKKEDIEFSCDNIPDIISDLLKLIYEFGGSLHADRS